MHIINNLQPIIPNDCEILILGTLPSEQSRKNEEYYNNKTNRFWEMICTHLGHSVPITYNGKVHLLMTNKIGVYDLIHECDIEGSKNSTITNATFNYINSMIDKYNIQLILLNGKDTYKKFYKKYSLKLNAPILAMQNTSRANGHFKQEIWDMALNLLKPQGVNNSSNLLLNNAMHKQCFLSYIWTCQSNQVSPYTKVKNKNTNTKDYKFNQQALTETAAVYTGIPIDTIKLILLEAINLGLI